MARQLRRATLLAPFLLLAAFLALSCFDDPSGPRTFRGQFSLAPQFESSVAGIVEIDRFRVLLRRTSDSSIALDTVITIAPGTDSVDLSLSVPMLTSSETFLLTLSLITPAGDTAFQAGPTTVTPSSAGGAPPAIPVTVVYVGVGANAASVRIVTDSSAVFFGDTVTLVAEALDSSGTVIPGTPIAWGSLDTLRARVPDITQGKVVGAAQRGPAPITATLITGPADTTGVQVQPVPVRAAVESGNNQSAQVATLLGQPVRFRVKAADSLGVAGLKVRFSVVSGGGLITPDSGVTNDSGRVEVQWKLGPTSGPQSIRARIAAAFADSLVTAGATALAGPPGSLAIKDGDGQAAVVGLALATAPSVVVRDALNNPVPGVAVTFAVTAGGGSVAGATPTTDATGVARVGSWTLGTVTGANALRAFVLRGPGDTMNVHIGATALPAAAASLTVTGIPSLITAGLTEDMTVTTKDAFGNVATGYLGTVHFTSSDIRAILPADYTFISGDSGAHTFSGGVTLLTSGAQSVTSTDTATPSVTGSQAVTVQPGAASPLTSVITVSSGAVASGGAATLTLQAKDAHGNSLTGGGAVVVFSASGGTSTGTISATTDHGNGTYSATFTAVTAGTATTIGATLNGVAVASALPTITVAAGLASAATSTVSVSSGTVVSGSSVTLTLQTKDAAGNNLTAGGLAVVFSASGGTSTGAIGPTTDLGNGTYTATFTGVTAGTATTIGATIGGTAVTSTLPAVTVIVGPISTSASTVTVSSATVTSGITATLKLRAKDAAGNNLTTGGATVVFNASGGTGVSTGTISATADSGNGVYTATFTGVLAGTATTIGATIGGGAVTTALPTITVIPGPASTAMSLVSVSSPTVTSGASLTLTLQGKDAAGNNLTSGGLTVLFSASGGTSTGTISPSPATDNANGTYTATFTGVTAGTPTTIEATINSSPVTTTLPTVEVTPGVPAALVFTTQPTNTTINATMAPFQVTALDAASNTATGFSGLVTLAFQNNPAGGSLGGTFTAVAASGVATFNNVRVTQVGSRYALQASATGVTSATSQQFLITPVGMTHLWTGATNTLWTVGTNWQGGSSPTLATHNVFVPASATNQPTGGAVGTAGDVVVETGATLAVGAGAGDTLYVSGNLLAGFTSVTGPGSVRLVGSGTLAGAVPTLVVAGSYTAADSVKVNGDLIVSGFGNNLNLGGRWVRVAGAFSTISHATVAMRNEADSLDVFGNVTFGGGNTKDSLMAGAIALRGNFVQLAVVDNSCFDFTGAGDTVETFYAGGTHRVRLIGTLPQSVSLATPGPQLEPPGNLLSECAPPYSGGSRFAHLAIDNAAGATFTGSGLITGNLTVVNGNLDATGQRLSVGGNVTTPGNLTAARLETGGALSFGAGVYSVGTSTFLGLVTAVPSTLPYQTLRLVGSGATTWSGPLSLTGSLVVGGTVVLQLGANSTVNDATVQGDGHLTLGGYKLSIPAGSFQTTGNGVLEMSNPVDTLAIGGFAYFQGGSTDGLLSAGTILVGGYLDQRFGSHPRSFRPSGANKVLLNGSGAPQGVFLAAPGDSYSAGAYVFGDSRFQHLEVTNPFGFFMGSDVYVAGNLTTVGGGGITDNSPGHTLRALNITTPSLAAATVDVGGTLTVSGTYSVGNTIFSGLGQTIPLYAYQNLKVNGTATFTTPPTISGDLSVGPGAQLDLGANQLAVPGNVDGGNTIINGTILMTGSAKTLKGTLPNLRITGTVSLGANATITGKAKVITGTGNLSVGAFTLTVGDSFIVDTAATLTMADAAGVLSAKDVVFRGGNTAGKLTAGLITVSGDFLETPFSADTVPFAPSGTHRVKFVGLGAQQVTFGPLSDAFSVRAHFQDLEIAGGVLATTTFATNQLVKGSLIVSSGTLDLGANTVTVDGNLSTSGTGVLVMAQGARAAPTMTVKGSATFTGGSTDTKLTAGTLKVVGNFSQSGDPKSFAASGTHQVVLGGASRSVGFASADSLASHFQHLGVFGFNTTTLASDVYVMGNLRVDTSTTITGPYTLTVHDSIITGFAGGGTLTPRKVRVGRALAFNSGSFAPDTAEFFRLAGVIPVNVAIAYKSIVVKADSVVLAGSATAAQDVTLAAGVLDLEGSTLTVGGKFNTQGTGALRSDSTAILDVAGDVTFSGGSTSARLTAGTFRFAGNLMQKQNGATTTTFKATGSLVVELDGTAAQTVHFDNPADAASGFNDLRVVNSSVGGVVLSSNIFVARNLLTPLDTTTQRLFGQGHLLTARGLNAQSIVFDSLPVSIEYVPTLTSALSLTTATFQRMDPTVTQISIVRNFETGTFTNVTFSTVPTTGLYLFFDDSDNMVNAAILNLSGTSPPTHGGKAQTDGVAQLIGWPP